MLIGDRWLSSHSVGAVRELPLQEFVVYPSGNCCKGIAFGQELSVYRKTYLPNAMPLRGTGIKLEREITDFALKDVTNSGGCSRYQRARGAGGGVMDVEVTGTGVILSGSDTGSGVVSWRTVSRSTIVSVSLLSRTVSTSVSSTVSA